MAPTLVIHPGPLGDVVLATPALRALRRRHAGDKIVLAAQSPVGELMHVLGLVDVRLRFDLLGLDTLFVDGPFDARTQALADAARLVCWFGSKDPTFAKRLVELVPNAIIAPPWVPDGLVWQHLLDTIGESVVAEDRQPVRVPARLVAEGRAALQAAGWDGTTPLLVVHPGASGAGKRWPVDGFAAVLGRLRARVAVIVHEGPADGDPVRALLPRLGTRAGVLANPTLPVLAGALSHARAFLGNDSGVSHLASSVGARSVVLFTSGMRAWEPWSPRARALVVSTRGLYGGDVDAVAEALGRVLA
ncbi:MAG: glycosyltransferase family 9 protein [Candidatus Rokubacteria bacterium]|nr:glycosyltransferase family 9 protein [Candidatus Rokubacteria bacterium]